MRTGMERELRIQDYKDTMLKKKVRRVLRSPLHDDVVGGSRYFWICKQYITILLTHISYVWIITMQTRNKSLHTEVAISGLACHVIRVRK